MSLFKNIIKHNQNEFTKYINTLTGIQFEHYTGNLLKAIGFKHVIVTRPYGDWGIDVIGIFNNKKIGIQCKHIGTQLLNHDEVGYRAIEEANTGKSFYNLDKAIVLTNDNFSKHAKYGAKRVGVELWNGNSLIKLNKYINHIIINKHTYNYHYGNNLKRKYSIKKLQAKHYKHLKYNNPILYETLTIINNPRAKCLAWILTHAKYTKNIVPCSQRTIAKESKTSFSTTKRVINGLKGFGLIKTKHGKVIISPMLIPCDNNKRFESRITKYNSLQPLNS